MDFRVAGPPDGRQSVEIAMRSAPPVFVTKWESALPREGNVPRLRLAWSSASAPCAPRWLMNDQDVSMCRAPRLGTTSRLHSCVGGGTSTRRCLRTRERGLHLLAEMTIMVGRRLNSPPSSPARRIHPTTSPRARRSRSRTLCGQGASATPVLRDVVSIREPSVRELAA